MKDKRLNTFVYESQSRNYSVFNLMALILNLNNYLVFYSLSFILVAAGCRVILPSPYPLPLYEGGGGAKQPSTLKVQRRK